MFVYLFVVCVRFITGQARHSLKTGQLRQKTKKSTVNQCFGRRQGNLLPIPSMHGIFTYIWLIFVYFYGKCR